MVRVRVRVNKNADMLYTTCLINLEEDVRKRPFFFWVRVRVGCRCRVKVRG
jgi:hypothetical protein